MKAQSHSHKASRSCWTCRKVGCDRSLPHCNNCIRTKRACEGYGPRLVWRRPESTTGCHSQRLPLSVNSTQNGIEFLNFNSRDLDLAAGRLDWHTALMNALAGPRYNPTLYQPGIHQERAIFSYYIQVIAPMCSTTHSDNGLWQEIPSVALSSHDASTDALFYSMLAISGHHRWGYNVANPFRTKAVEALTRSLTYTNNYSQNSTPSQLAAVMMLCMHSVFDVNEGQFYTHLEGARRVLHNLSLDYKQSKIAKFLSVWVMYYDVLDNFAHPLRQTQCAIRHEIPLEDSSTIIGLLGCSPGVFGVIHRINVLRADILSQHNDIRELTEASEERSTLEAILLSSEQRLSPDETNYSLHPSPTEALAKAELYRLAALLYLQRVVPVDGDEERRTVYLQQALFILTGLSVASSPWPCFIIACEVKLEEQRLQILEVLDKMESARNVGNMQVTRAIVETVWKHQDLRVGMEQAGWWSCPSFDLSVPWFA